MLRRSLFSYPIFHLCDGRRIGGVVARQVLGFGGTGQGSALEAFDECPRKVPLGTIEPRGVLYRINSRVFTRLRL